MRWKKWVRKRESLAEAERKNEGGIEDLGKEGENVMGVGVLGTCTPGR